MIAAIYARKSTEQHGVVEPEKSVARQVADARAYAARKGWGIAEDHVYVDDAVSGAEFTEKRDGLHRLLAALRLDRASRRSSCGTRIGWGASSPRRPA